MIIFTKCFDIRTDYMENTSLYYIISLSQLNKHLPIKIFYYKLIKNFLLICYCIYIIIISLLIYHSLN